MIKIQILKWSYLKKIKFKSLEEITNENTFDSVVQEGDEQYNYCSANTQFNLKWFTKNNNVRNAGRHSVCNVVERPIGSLGAPKNVTTPVDAWGVFIKNELLEKVVATTNKIIEEFRNRFQETLESS